MNGHKSAYPKTVATDTTRFQNSPAAAAAAGGVVTSTGGLPALGSWRQALVQVQPTPFKGAGRPGGMAVTANGKRGKVKAALYNMMDEGPMRCVRMKGLGWFGLESAPWAWACVSHIL